MMSNRVLCVYRPHFRVAVERQRRPELAQAPLVIYRPGPRPVVVEGCARAEETGVAPGMLLSRALSLCPQAVAVPQEERLYGAANDEMLQPLLRLTPEVEAGELGVAFMGLRGVALTAPASLSRMAKEGGEGGRLGIATGRFAAEMAARHGPEAVTVVPAGEEAGFLARLPLEVLPAPDAAWREMRRRLRLLGLTTLGDVARLGQVAMQSQFGAAGLAAWRLASGRSQPLRPAPMAHEVEVKRQFEAPLTAWPDMLTVLAEMAGGLGADLRREGWACVSLQVVWQVEGKAEETREVALKEPTAATAAILAMARRCLEGAVTGPVAEVWLRARALAPESGKQISLFEGRQRSTRLERVAAELQQRLGKAALCRVQPLAPGHLEERTYTFRPLAAG